MSLKDKLNGRRVIASVSGGKDSAAMCLWLQEQGIEHDRVFMDTGWEHDSTYEYLRGPLTDKLGRIIEIKAKAPNPTGRIMELLASGSLRPRVHAAIMAGNMMVMICIHKGILPSSARWCTEELKQIPFANYLAAHHSTVDVISAVGVRSEESKGRAELTEWEESAGLDCEVWRPLIAWTEQRVIEIHHQHNLRPNPLYLLGANRVGCWPCKYAKKSELRLISEMDPERIALVRDLEMDIADIQAGKIRARGEEVEHGPSWFRVKIGSEPACWPIDKAVAWSRTTRGGRQLELLAAPSDRGCMRWGLCDTGGK